MKLYALIAAVVLVAGLRPRWFASLLHWYLAVAGPLIRRPWIAVLSTGVLAFGLYAGISLTLGESPPHVHDEFANLLAAETFADGRLTNPSPKLWPFFEEIHVLSVPTRMSKYPPAQGLMLAVGLVLTKKAIVGTWLTVALAAAAICWALQAWVPSRWALLGGLLMVVNPLMLKWSQVYWGGAEAVLGGALLVGALRRLENRPGIGHSLAYGAGLVILAYSRPFEGMVLALLTAPILGITLWRQRQQLSVPVLLRLSVPAGLVLALGLGWLGYYNQQVTGSALRMPYMEHMKQYCPLPFLFFLKPSPETPFNHPFIHQHHVTFERDAYERQQTLPGLAGEMARKGLDFGRNYLCRWMLLAPLAFLPWLLWRQRRPRLVLAVLLLFVGVVFLETWAYDRYFAPGFVLVWLVVILGIRQMCAWRPCRLPYGRALAVLVLLACLGQSLLWLKNRRWEYAQRDWEWQRLEVIRDLEKQGGRHLVVVRYGPKQSVHNDWVHNPAKLETAPILFARDMGAEKNQELLAYCQDRKIWLLEAENTYQPAAKDFHPARLSPYVP